MNNYLNKLKGLINDLKNKKQKNQNSIVKIEKSILIHISLKHHDLYERTLTT